ncbi:MAG: hypothetical protein J6Y53_03555 [Alphaproteobacteria bacterium]|nr:hypothetical protein [Alphaproteobacteria bacterium]
MVKTKSFYYKFNPINFWTILNILLVVGFVYTIYNCNSVIYYWWQTWCLIGMLGISIALWTYKYAFRHRMALIDDKTIKIDHCEPVAWKDLESAEEKIVRCGFENRKVIVLKPKKGIKYKYNFLQKHNAGFSPFSIPLYGILSKNDEGEIVKLIKSKLSLKECK